MVYKLFDSNCWLLSQLLDLGNIDPALPCSDHRIKAMVRSDQVKVGDIYNEPISGAKVEITDVSGWVESVFLVIISYIPSSSANRLFTRAASGRKKKNLEEMELIV